VVALDHVDHPPDTGSHFCADEAVTLLTCADRRSRSNINPLAIGAN
jgi:hypothetical protein